MPVLKYRDPSTGNYVALAVGTSDHGSLAGLTDDDHPQYLPITGSRDMSGSLVVAPASGSSTITLNVADTGAEQQGGLYIRRRGQMRWKITKIGDAAGDLEIRRYDDTGSLISGTPIGIDRSNGIVTMPNVNIAALKPHATGGYEWAGYDSGWCSVTSLGINGWVFGAGSIRRHGNQCFLRVFNLNPANKTSNIFFNIPTGFGYAGVGPIGLFGTRNSAGALVRIVESSGSNSLTIVSASTSDSTFSGTLQWFTDASWPGSYPGTPQP